MLAHFGFYFLKGFSHLVDVSHRTLLVRTMSLPKDCWNGHEAGALRLPHAGCQGGAPDLLLRHIDPQLHAPQLDHAHKGGERVATSQGGGHGNVARVKVREELYGGSLCSWLAILRSEAILLDKCHLGAG